MIEVFDNDGKDSVYRRVEPEIRRRGSLSDEIAAYIRDLILTGALKPGEKIDQDAVSQALDVSRSPIREALVVLGQEGLLDVTPRRGAFVARLTPEDIVDHYELFGVVSGRAASLAATTLTHDQIDALVEVHGRFDATSSEDLSALNHQFHRLINSAAPRRTRWLLRHLERSVPANYYEFADGWNGHTVEHHGAIVDALKARDGEAARIAMEHHLRESGLAAAEALRLQGFWDE